MQGLKGEGSFHPGETGSQHAKGYWIMSGTISVSRSGDDTIISITGRFNYALNVPFREAYEAEDPGRHFIIDFAETQDIDSSALGMLLLLREHTDAADVELINARANVRKALEIANISRIFKMT